MPYNDWAPDHIIPPTGWRAWRYRVTQCLLRRNHWWEFSVLRPRLQIDPPVIKCAICGRIELDDYDYDEEEEGNEQ